MQYNVLFMSYEFNNFFILFTASLMDLEPEKTKEKAEDTLTTPNKAPKIANDTCKFFRFLLSSFVRNPS